MRISPQGINFILKHENCKLTLYKDSANHYTIGVGHKCSTAQIQQFKNGISKPTAIQLLHADLITPTNSVNNLGLNLLQHQADALISLIFNIGSGNFAKSTLKQVLLSNCNNFTHIKTNWLKFSYANKKFVKGLYNRRLNETNLYINNIY